MAKPRGGNRRNNNEPEPKKVKIPKKQKQKTGKKSVGLWVTVVGVAVAAMVYPLLVPSTSTTTSSSPSSQQPEEEFVSPHVTKFLESFVCEEGFCANELVEPYGRSHRATRPIAAGTTLFKIPRSLQIWDLDAIRWLSSSSSPDVVEKMPYTHMTGKPLDGGAYLALFMWHRFVHQPNENDPLLSYFHDILPTTTNLLSHHPILWKNDLPNLLKLHSHAHAVARAYRDMVHSEYRALSSSGYYPSLKENMYTRLRILVLSRSFGTGAPTESEQQKDQAASSLQEELQHYNETFGIDFTLGCRAMVPILDMYNHHATPNIEWRYQDGSYVITAAADGIATRDVLYDSYGTYTDAHLLAKFGFVQADGSGHTEASMAAFHRLMNLGLRQQFDYLPNDRKEYVKLVSAQKILLARYLQFDDGYAQCITQSSSSSVDDSSDDPAYRLKQLKLQHLMRCAHDPKRWIVTVPPRNPNAKPTDAAPLTPLAFDSPPPLNANSVLSTCRLMVLTEHDYDGRAVHVLETHLQQEAADAAINVGPQSDALEYRALLCLARWTGLVLHRLEIPSVKAFAQKQDIGKVHSKTWTAHHVLLGEAQSLQLVNQLAVAGAHQRAKAIGEDNLPEIRRLPCEWNYTKALAEATKFV